VLLKVSAAFLKRSNFSCFVLRDRAGESVGGSGSTSIPLFAILLWYIVEEQEEDIDVSLKRLILIEGVFPLTLTLLLGEVPKDLSIPVLLVGNTVGKENCCELDMIVELKVVRKKNLFAIFPISTTMQDGGKRKRSDCI